MTNPAHPAQHKRKVVDRAFSFAIDGQTKAYESPDGQRILEGIATTPRVDRAGDTIDPKGLAFQLPLPLLWQHDPERPIGNVVAAAVTPAGITFRAVLPPEGTHNIVDLRWSELTAGLVRFLSIGFRATATPKKTATGYHYPKAEWLELSAVTIPANPDCAITALKAFEIPDGESAAHAHNRDTTMTIKEQIAARKARIAELRAQVAEMVDTGLTPESTRDFEALNAELEEEITARDLLVRTLKNSADDAQPVTTPRDNGNVPVVTRTSPQVAKIPRAYDKQREPAQTLFRACGVAVLAYARHASPEQVAAELWADDELLKGYLLHQKAAVEPALTTVPEWAGNLARETWGEFLNLLLPESVYAQLSAIGARFTFGNAGKIMLPARNKDPNLAGDFIGENQPIPVKKGSIVTSVLTPKKLAVISAYSREMAVVSAGQIEAYIRQFMVEDTAQVIDAKLLDNVAANAVRPAGLLNGVTLTPSAGSTLADIITDVKAAMTPILTANGGRRLVWLMNPLQAMSLGLQTNAAGAFIFPSANERFLGYQVIVSNNVPAGTLLLVDAADFATVANDTPQFYISNEATLHMESATPEPINDGTPATPVISLFQQDSFAVRMIQQMNWTMRRTGMVSGISGITW